jgi:8-oxo-dGTP diphosphatase
VSERHVARLATVAFVTHADDVLLLRRSRDADRFVGQWNGVGGHVESGEDVLGAARREVREETGLEVPLRLRGIVHETGMQGAAYVVFFFAGPSPGRSLSAAPGHELAWHPRSSLEGLALVSDLSAILPRVLVDGPPFFATERYDGADGLLTITFSEEAG